MDPFTRIVLLQLRSESNPWIAKTVLFSTIDAMTKASSTLEFRPLEIGLDYMTSVVDLLAGSPTERDLKYAVLHLSDEIEVLLKARLAQEHWTLVLDNVDEASKLKHERGDFISVGIESAMRRLTETA